MQASPTGLLCGTLRPVWRLIKAKKVACLRVRHCEPLQNRYVWERGEPAYLKYWMRDSATLLSSAALRQEEGFSQVLDLANPPPSIPIQCNCQQSGFLTCQ